ISFPPITVLKNELKDFEYRYTESHNLIFSAPPGKHDDCVTSLMLAAWRLQDSGEIPLAVSTSVTSSEAIPKPVDIEDDALMQRQKNLETSLRFIESMKR